MMTAPEIKNKFIYTLSLFSEREIKVLWAAYVPVHGTDEFAFVSYLLREFPAGKFPI